MENIFKEYALEKAERSLHWLEEAHKHYMRKDVNPKEVGGYITDVIIYGNQIDSNMEITTEILELIYQHNKQSLEDKILRLKKELGEI